MRSQKMRSSQFFHCSVLTATLRRLSVREPRAFSAVLLAVTLLAVVDYLLRHMAHFPSRTAFPLESVQTANSAEFAVRGVNGERASFAEHFACESLRLTVFCRAAWLSRGPAHAAEGFAGARCGA